MKLLAGIGVLGVLGGGLYASDALTAGTVYDKPYAQAYADLADMTLVSGTETAAGVSNATVVERNPDSIGWRLTMGPVEVGRFTATLSPVGADRTRVSVNFAPTPAMSTESPILTSDLMTDFARLAMVEQIDARMENRLPDLREVHWAAARHLQAHPEQMKAFGGAVQEQFRQVATQLKQDSAASAQFKSRLKEVELNYAPPPDPRDATRPTTVFPED